MSGEVGDATDAPQARGGAVIFITLLLDMLALGIIIPILPKLIEGFVSNDTANAARVFGLCGSIWALMQLICSPILGGLSDRFGRRPVVLLSNFGLAAGGSAVPLRRRGRRRTTRPPRGARRSAPRS